MGSEHIQVVDAFNTIITEKVLKIAHTEQV